MAVGEKFYSRWKTLFASVRGTISSFIAPDSWGWGGASWYQLGGNSPIWLDTNDLWKVYNDVPHLNVIINTKADLLSQGRIRLRSTKDGKEILKHDVLDLLRKPNPLQSQAEFITMYSTFKDIWGNVPIYKNYGVMINNQPLTKIPGQLWCLPPVLMTIKPTGKLFRQLKVEEIVEYYEIKWNGGYDRFSPKEILFKNDNLSSEYLKSESKIIGLRTPLSNIYACLETANVLTKEHGAYGILSTAGKGDSSGILPMGKVEKKRVEDQYNSNYGLQFGKRKTIITGSSLTYTPISFPVKDMNLDIEIEQDFGIVLGAYGLKRDMFSSTKGATNENQKQATKQTIQTTIQSEGDDLMNTLNMDFDLLSEGIELYMTFDHLAIMQEDEVQRQNAEKIKAEKLAIMLVNNVISRDTFAIEMGVDLSTEPAPKGATDSLGKIPLAIQQLALARERANTAGDAALSEQIRQAMDKLTEQLVNEVINAAT